MIKYYAKDFGVLPNIDVSVALVKLFNELKSLEEPASVIFDNGTYIINAKNCEKHLLNVTNTVGENEYSKDEVRHIVPVAFYMEKLQNIVFEFNNSEFILNGKCTNMVLVECENIVIKDLEINASHPDIHELKVTNKTAFTVEFETDKNTIIEDTNSHPCFVGEDYKNPVNLNAKRSWWNGYIDARTPDKVIRNMHPLADAFNIKKNGNNGLKARYFSTSRFNIGDRYYIYNVRRDYVGIFVNKCSQIEIENVKQSISYSLALVLQDTQNVLVNSVRFAPNENDFLMSSVADFIQVCMCRGDIVVKDSYFEGAGDDLLNVHGVHFEIIKRNANKITVAFKHPQTHSYNPLRIGDKIAFIDKETLLEKDSCVIKNSYLLNDNEIELEIDKLGNFVIGDVIEDVSACPNLIFKNNKSTRIITRGLLITTRGKVLIENNEFKSTSMSGILLSDDAKSWYESGMCKDVTIKDNTFDYCGQTPILIKPENAKHSGYVHSNITIENNIFRKYDGPCIDAKSTKNINIVDNLFSNVGYLKIVDCEDITTNNNRVSF